MIVRWYDPPGECACCERPWERVVLDLPLCERHARSREASVRGAVASARAQGRVGPASPEQPR